MCGFIFTMGNIKKSELSKAINSISHRGPDDKNFYFDDKERISIGHCRLSIVDDKNGTQPFISNDKNLILLFNGEIYNYHYLKKKLEKNGVKFLTKNSDTELVLKAYEFYGEEVFKLLDGQFAILIYNKKKNEVVIARDQFGEKPVFYYFNDGIFVAGSELRIFENFYNLNLKINLLSLQRYFIYSFIPAPETLYKNIYKVEKSFIYKIDLKNNKINKKKYFDPLQYNISNRANNYNDNLEELDCIIEKSVKSRLISDHKIGLFLSGGIDSSLIAQYAKFNSFNDIDTFTISVNEKTFDESLKAKNFSDHLGLKNYSTKLTLENFNKRYADILAKLDEPIGAPTFVPMYILSEFATSYGNKSVLCGDGGDEIFGGYDVFRFSSLYNFLNIFINRKSKNFFKGLSNLFSISDKNLSFDFKLRRFIRGMSFDAKYRNTFFLSSLDINNLEDLFEIKIDIEQLLYHIIEFDKTIQHLSLYDQTILYYLEFYLPELVCARADKAGMLNSLEIRSPFLNTSLLKFALEMQLKYKNNIFQTKKILRDLLKTKVNKKFIDNGKLGFTFPIQKWLNVDLNYNTKYLNNKSIENLKKSHMAGRGEFRNFFHCLNSIKKFI
jgi:asparagine synthase (glutamine-hydrolysing)